MRIIAHVDMDAFFAAVEERYNPQFRGKPIVVGADPKEGQGRGVVSTASYAARKYGIKSAMPISKAWRLAEDARRRGEPETIFLRGQHRLYAEVSARIMAIVSKEADAFEEASIDEAYLEWKSETLSPKPEITAPSRTKVRLGGAIPHFREPTSLIPEVSVREVRDPRNFSAPFGRGSCGTLSKVQSLKFQNGEWGVAEERAQKLKASILKAEGLTCSIGIGPNKLIAKIASDFKKPDGLTIVRPEEVQAFLDPLPIRVIPGIGPKGEAFLHAQGIRTISELRSIELARLTEWLGKWGEDLYRKARGESESEVLNEGEPKSIGEQETFEQDTLQPAFILERARALGEAVFRRLRAEGFSSFRTAVVTVRFADFTTLTRSHTSSAPLATESLLHAEVLRLLLPFLDRRENPRRKRIRLIGVRVEKLAR